MVGKEELAKRIVSRIHHNVVRLSVDASIRANAEVLTALGECNEHADLRVDGERRRTAPECGIYVRAQDAGGKWLATDINHLDADSLRMWLGANPYTATNAVFRLLGRELP